MFRTMLMFIYEYLNRGRQLMDTNFTLDNTTLIILENLSDAVYSGHLLMMALCILLQFAVVLIAAMFIFIIVYGYAGCLFHLKFKIDLVFTDWVSCLFLY